MSYSVVTVATLQAVLLGVALMASHPATVASAEPRMSVIYNASRISIEASGVTVAEVLREGRSKSRLFDCGSQVLRSSVKLLDSRCLAARGSRAAAPVGESCAAVSRRHPDHRHRHVARRARRRGVCAPQSA